MVWLILAMEVTIFTMFLFFLFVDEEPTILRRMKNKSNDMYDTFYKTLVCSAIWRWRCFYHLVDPNHPKHSLSYL